MKNYFKISLAAFVAIAVIVLANLISQTIMSRQLGKEKIIAGIDFYHQNLPNGFNIYNQNLETQSSHELSLGNEDQEMTFRVWVNSDSKPIVYKGKGVIARFYHFSKLLEVQYVDETGRRRRSCISNPVRWE